MVRMAQELRDQFDTKGHRIDFGFCSRCFKFLSLDDYRIGQEIICKYCSKGDKVLS